MEESPDSPERREMSGEENSPIDSPERQSKYEQYEPPLEDELILRQQLLDSKMGRKRAEEDAKVLANRIQLLKQEEAKVYRITHK